jgi:hypothetical protein
MKKNYGWVIKGGQKYFTKNHEKSSRDQNRRTEKEKSFKVGHCTLSEPETRCCHGEQQRDPFEDLFQLCDYGRAYVPDGNEQIRVVDICDLCQRIRTFWTETDGVCAKKAANDPTGQACLISFYSAKRPN